MEEIILTADLATGKASAETVGIHGKKCIQALDELKFPAKITYRQDTDDMNKPPVDVREVVQEKI